MRCTGWNQWNGIIRLMTDDDKKHETSFGTLAPGESITIDTGDKSFTFTASASLSANAALASLAIVPPSPERDKVMKAQRHIGGMTLAELQREIAILSADGASPDPSFGSLDPAIVKKFLEFETKAREDGRSEGRGLKRDVVLVVLGVAGTVIATLLTKLLT